MQSDLPYFEEYVRSHHYCPNPPEVPPQDEWKSFVFLPLEYLTTQEKPQAPGHRRL